LIFKTNDTSRINISTKGVTTIGKTTDHTKIETDGTLILEGAATVWEDLRVALDKGANAAQLGFLPGAISGPEIWYFRNAAGVEAMSFTVQMPHNWKEGSIIHPHIHWIPKTTGAGNVEWNFEYTWANYNPGAPEIFPAVTTSTVVASGPFLINSNLITGLTANNVGIVATGKTVSSILICRIWRDSGRAADTYVGDAGGLSLDFHYEINSIGSHSEYTK